MKEYLEFLIPFDCGPLIRFSTLREKTQRADFKNSVAILCA